MTSRHAGVPIILVLWVSVVLSTSASAQARATAGDGPQHIPQSTDSLTSNFKEKELIPVLDVLREYAKTRRPDLLRELDEVELVVPNQPDFDANATAFRWEHSDVVTINLLLMLDLTALAELVAVSSTRHPDAESAYNKTVADYEYYLQNVRRNRAGEPFVVYNKLRSGVLDSLDVDSIRRIGEVIRRDIVAWAVLHEISHHILGHTQINNTHPSVSESRKLELDADISSFGLLNDLGFSLTNVRSFFGLRSRIEPMLIKHGAEPLEDKSDHPSWATRLRALEDYIAKNHPPKNLWIAFGADKFVDDERLAGTYRLIALHSIFPTEPAAWGNLAFTASWENTLASGASPSLSPIAVSIENGEAHLYWRSDIFISHLVIENPYSDSSRTTFTMTTVSDGERHTSHDIVARDSAFRWRPDGSVGNVSLSEFQVTPQKDVILKIARSMIQDQKILDEVQPFITELVKSEGDVFLDYMKGTITEDRYVGALRLLYGKMFNNLQALIGEELAEKLMSLVVDSPYCVVRNVREKLGLGR